MRFIFFGLNLSFAFKKRIKQLKGGGTQTSDTKKIQSSTPQHFQMWQTPSSRCLRPICSFALAVASFFIFPLFLILEFYLLFSDYFQDVARHKTALLSTLHSDEAASFALAAHTNLRGDKRNSGKHFRPENTNTRGHSSKTNPSQ